MTCEVCAAPALSVSGVWRGACVFCHSPLTGGTDPAGLLDYVGARLPGARVRHGLLGRGPVQEVRLQAGGELFRGRLRNEVLELEPEPDPAAWVDRLLAALSRGAASDADLREAVSHAGWALR